MASIYQRNGKFYGSFQEGGKWVKRLLGETREAAERRLDEIVNGARGPVEVTRFHFPAAVNSYLKKIRIYAKPRSVAMAGFSCRHLLDYFAEHNLDRRGVEKFIEWRSERVSAKTINNDLVVLRAILHHAVEVGLLSSLPFKIRLVKTSKKRVLRILSPEDIRRLLRAAKHPYRGILLVAANTGFRLDEILQLAWKDVFWQENRLAVTAKQGWTPKSYQERSCYVSQGVMDYTTHRNAYRFVFAIARLLGISRATARRLLLEAGIRVVHVNPT